MCVMPAEQQQPPAETVVEFGASEPARPGTRRRWSASEVIAGLGADRRTVPLAAVVGGVALFASLISEWQVTQLQDAQLELGFGENRPVPAGLADLGALGSGYVVGLLVLAVSVVLMLFGPPAGRGYARLIGLSVAGVQAGLLAALTQTLGAGTRSPLGLFAANLPEDQVQLTYGRGIWCAAVGVAAVALALWLAGRHLAAAPAEPAGPDDESASEPAEVWSWRRPRSTPEDILPDAPIDLEVTSSRPFTSRDEDRDGPGISG